MAQNDVEAFDEFLYDLCLAEHNLDTGVLKLGLCDSSLTTPVKTTAIPHWGGTGTTDMSADEALTTGTYTGPITLSNPTVTNSAGTIQLDWDDPAAMIADPLNDTAVQWGIVYNDSHVDKHCIGWVDLGTAFDHTTGTLTITFGAPAMTLNQAV
jgi:hypothetical protein